MSLGNPPGEAITRSYFWFTFFWHSYSNGVKIDVENNTVYVELYLIMKRDINLLETSRIVQQKVKRAILEMVGMEIGTINIHIEDIDYKD